MTRVTLSVRVQAHATVASRASRRVIRDCFELAVANMASVVLFVTIETAGSEWGVVPCQTSCSVQ